MVKDPLKVRMSKDTQSATSLVGKSGDGRAPIEDCTSYADAVRSSTTVKPSNRRKRGKRGKRLQRKAEKFAMKTNRDGSDAAARQQRGTKDNGAAGRSRRRHSGDDIGKLIKQQNRLIGQLVGSVQQMQRAITTLSLAVAVQGQKKTQQQQRQQREPREQRKGGSTRITPKPHLKQVYKPNWKVEKLQESAKQLKHRQRQDRAKQMVRAIKKVRMRDMNTSECKATVLQQWAHNAPSFLNERLERITVNDTIIAVAELSNSRTMMHKHVKMAEDLALKGIVNARQMKEKSGEFKGLSPRMSYIKVSKALADERFIGKLCCLHHFHFKYWTYVDTVGSQLIPKMTQHILDKTS